MFLELSELTGECGSQDLRTGYGYINALVGGGQSPPLRVGPPPLLLPGVDGAYRSSLHHSTFRGDCCIGVDGNAAPVCGEKRTIDCIIMATSCGSHFWNKTLTSYMDIS